jgi:hypothetical protein
VSAFHVCKLPHGKRIDATTFTRKGSRHARVKALCYDGSELIATHTRNFPGMATVGQLIDERAAWLDTLAKQI